MQITLSSGHTVTHSKPASVREIVASYDAKLAKKMIAAEVDGMLVDCHQVIQKDVFIKVIMPDDPEGLDIIRHSTAHLLAQAVKQLFPEVQVTIGPVIESGFYYDFYRPEGFKEADLARIEKRMRQLIKQNLPVARAEISRDEAVTLFSDMGEDFKTEIIREIPQEERLSIYTQGDFVDLCRGPHVPSTGKLGAFKLTKLAGAYWRGDSDNAMLQRIYGTAWQTQEKLDNYLKNIEEAKKRDHRILAKKMDLFHVEELAPGMVFWHPNGWVIYRQLTEYIRILTKQYGYQEVATPSLVDRSLWEKSGHWEKFQDVMFVTQSDKRDYVIKPMNCPCHVEIYNKTIHSYRDLPLRLSEFTTLHRDEPSGTLHGIMRIRQFAQDDAHIFCTPAQIAQEVKAFIAQTIRLYKTLGFKDILIYFSSRPEQRVGSDEIWDQSEAILIELLNQQSFEWQHNPGEGAFYGPKIEFSLRDSLDRIWQCGTIQLDFSMPSRLGATYIAQDGSKQVPVMLHRAMLGSVERFLGVMLEDTEGALPLWLMPYHIVVVNITDDQTEYANAVVEECLANGFRAKADLRNEKIGYKIREHSIARTPFILVCGNQEKQDHTVSVRDWRGNNLGAVALNDFMQQHKAEIEFPV